MWLLDQRIIVKFQTTTINLFRRDNSANTLFSSFEKSLIFLYKKIGFLFPMISIPAMLAQIKSVTGPILFFVGDSKFKSHSQRRKEEGIVLNVNLIGEALLGEEEAAERIKNYIELVNQPEVDYISIKLSTIFSQISSLAHRYTVENCVRRLSILYDEILAVKERTGEAKFINLDMEEYRDLHITIDTFKETLELPRFKNLRMGIVLQAYLPDSYNALVDLTNWASNRVNNGGAPIKVRIVKGANLEMERTEASLEEWPVAPYETKVESDANFKKMMLYAFNKDHLDAVHIGIASHNIFDLSFALKLIQDNNLKNVDIEMLEGMANEVVDELLSKKASVLLYTPIVKTENYNSAIAYLVRRLDEGTQEGNFLKEGHELKVNTSKWSSLKEAHLKSIDLIPTLSSAPKRTQNRATETFEVQTSFHNVANTDWVLPANRTWIESYIQKWQNPVDIVGEVIPVVIDGPAKEREIIEQVAWSGTHPFKYERADLDDYENFLAAESEWTTMSTAQRAELLRKAAVEMEKERGNLICTAICELGKTVKEVDVEVSEAIDFANYYAQNALDLESEYGIEILGGGTNLVLSPWNFPIAIPIGGVLASLAAGKKVILKPSTNSTLCGYMVAKCLWEAGIPKSAFALLPTKGSNLNPLLSEGNVFDAVILTGGTDTAHFLLDRNPDLNLYAETGGKNSTIVTSLSDRDQAIKNVVWSAFGNAGQKCSATSLLILEKEVYNDKHFKQLLKDAAESKVHGNPWNLETEMGPLAVTISDKIRESIESTPKDRWLLEPKLEGNFMLSPGIKWGVTEDEFEYKNELFGPILAVMQARDLDDAIRLANGVEFGLTSGLESLDTREVAIWKDKIQAGNIYVNRSTTGAIVQRQPFGGMKASCFGYGMKAGGLNYVLQLANTKTKTTDYQKSYNDAWNSLFSKEIDYAGIRGQHNKNRYLKPEMVHLIIDDTTDSHDIDRVGYAAELIGSKLAVTDIAEISRVEAGLDHSSVIRSLCSSLPNTFKKACHQKAVHIYDRPVSNHGRIELLNYLTEQNFSYNFHRYGNLMGES